MNWSSVLVQCTVVRGDLLYTQHKVQSLQAKDIEKPTHCWKPLHITYINRFFVKIPLKNNLKDVITDITRKVHNLTVMRMSDTGIWGISDIIFFGMK